MPREGAMEFNIWAGMLGGFVGTLVMTAMMKASTSMGMTNMPGMPLIQGAMLTDDPDKARKIGIMMHLIVMGTVVFGILYAALLAAFGGPGWLTGLIIGVVHGIVAGIFMKPMGTMHPRMQPAADFAAEESWRHDATGLH